MKKNLLFISVLWISPPAKAQLFEMKKTYTGSHYGFTHFDVSGINRFVVGFNQMWANDLSTGFSQYRGNELGEVFTTSGFRLIWGKKESFRWTGSSDYAFGSGKDKNKAEFINGITQHMVIKARNHQVNGSFGISVKENKYWLEGLYSTNLGKVIIEYSTEHKNGIRSYGPEYKLNGLYTGFIKTMEFGIQLSYKYKKYVMYSRLLLPVIVMGPGKNERNFSDERSSYSDPRDFPSNYQTYVNDPSGHYGRREGLQSTDFKGYSFGFGMFYLIGKNS